MASKLIDDELGRRNSLSSQSTLSEEDEETDGEEVQKYVNPRDCGHKKVNSEGTCRRCGFELPYNGSFFDTGTVKSFIKLVYVDETKKSKIDKALEAAAAKTDEKEGEGGSGLETDEDEDEEEKKEEGKEDVKVDGTEEVKEEDKAQPEEQPIVENDPEPIEEEPVVPDTKIVPLLIKKKKKKYKGMLIVNTIYEQYTPLQSHEMREYMLYMVTKNVRYMKKHQLINDHVYD